MQEPTTATPGGAGRWTRADWCLVALLLVVAAGIRTWQIAHTEVAARDSIGFIRIAWQLHQRPLAEWPRVLAAAEQHPVYPLAVLGASVPVRALVDGPEADRMRLSAQAASAACAVLLVLPVFSLGRQLFDRRAGLGAALLVQCLPVSGRLLADGLSEATFLLFAASALLWSVRALRCRRAPAAFALAGLFGALAYLTRPEGALLVAATGVVLLLSQAVAACRRPAGDLLLNGGALSLAALLLAGPFVAITGQITLKPSAQRILPQGPGALAPPAMKPGSSGAVLFADYEVYTKPPSERARRGLAVLGAQLVKGSFHVGWAAALFGLWWHRRRAAGEPGAWVMLLVCLGVAFALWRIFVVVGYLSDRHTLLILLCGCYWAAAGLLALGEWLADRVPHPGRRGLAAAALPVLFAVSGLPKTLQPLHEHRSGFREVGLWLAEHSRPGDTITDPLCWSHYYAGHVFLEGAGVGPPPGHHPREFVVVEDAGNPHPRLPTFAQAREKAARAGPPVFSWPVRRGKNTGEVLVYALPREP